MKLNTHLKGCDTALLHCCENTLDPLINKETRLSLIVALMMLRNNVDLVDLQDLQIRRDWWKVPRGRKESNKSQKCGKLTLSGWRYEKYMDSAGLPETLCRH